MKTTDGGLIESSSTTWRRNSQLNSNLFIFQSLQFLPQTCQNRPCWASRATFRERTGKLKDLNYGSSWGILEQFWEKRGIGFLKSCEKSDQMILTELNVERERELERHHP